MSWGGHNLGREAFAINEAARSIGREGDSSRDRATVARMFAR